MSFFRKFEHVCRLKWQSELNIIGHETKWYSYHFMQFQYIPLLNLPENLRKRTQTVKNIWKWSFFVGFSTPGCWTRSENKLKSIRQATTCGTIIIPCNSNINHSLTCPKISGNCPKRLEILKKKRSFISLSTSPCQLRS